MAFTLDEYNIVCEMAESKGFPKGQLPKGPKEIELPDVDLANERDVEIHFVEPLLVRLGYSPADWRYQMRISMGRGERNVPDYVLGADETKGEELGVALVESKHEIQTSKDRRKAFVQAKSYALRLEVLSFSLAAKQGLWVYCRTGGRFDEDQYLYKTWSELAHPDKFAEVDKVLGKRAIDAELASRKRRLQK